MKIKNFLHIFLLVIIFLLISSYIKGGAPGHLQDEMGLYKGVYFTFEYPIKYTLSEEGQRKIYITSVERPSPEELKACTADEIAMQSCMMSPNITIEYAPGEPATLIEAEKVSDSYFFVSDLEVSGWKYYEVASEWLGKRKYIWSFDKGLIIASIVFHDTQPVDSGQFEAMHSEQYQLSRSEQIMLVEDIIQTLDIIKD